MLYDAIKVVEEENAIASAHAGSERYDLIIWGLIDGEWDRLGRVDEGDWEGQMTLERKLKYPNLYQELSVCGEVLITFDVSR